MPRFHCPWPLATGQSIDLPPGAARHVQVLRMQPGQAITLFNGRGGEYQAVIERMGRSDVAITVGAHHPVEREADREIHLAVGLPANDRMDWLVEKATELGVAGIWPLMAGRSVLRLSGERAAKKQAHWQGIVIAACEQSGRNRVPVVHDVRELGQWTPPAGTMRIVLSLKGDASSLSQAAGSGDPVIALSGPEGGLTPQEEDAAIASGFVPLNLGPRVLRAETAPLALLAALTLTR